MLGLALGIGLGLFGMSAKGILRLGKILLGIGLGRRRIGGLVVRFGLGGLLLGHRRLIQGLGGFIRPLSRHRILMALRLVGQLLRNLLGLLGLLGDLFLLFGGLLRRWAFCWASACCCACSFRASAICCC